MRLPRAWTNRLRDALLIRVALRRKPDFVIGGADGPYLSRWWVIPRNPIFNIYLHHFKRSDDDRALHDHPWCSLSVILAGGYFEHTHALPRAPKFCAAHGMTKATWRGPGAVIFRRAKVAHRVELAEPDGFQSHPVWTLFITGPRIRSWGFWCPKGWRHWREFTSPHDGGATIGKGCGE